MPGILQKLGAACSSVCSIRWVYADMHDRPLRCVPMGAQDEAQPLLDRSASHMARHWTIAAPKLIGAGALAGTSAGCLATLSGIGGPPLILMYELLAVPKV